MVNKEVNIIVKANDKATKWIRGVASRLKNLWKESWKSAKQVKSSWASMISSFNKLAIVSAGAFAVKKIIDFGWQLQNTAKDLELLDKKSSIVFWEFKSWVEEVAKSTAHSMGLTTNEFIGASAGIADILVPLGFAREESAKMSTELVTLSGALAEWSNWQYNAEQASEILQKAMVGEVDQLKQMWIVVDQSSKQFNERIATMMKDKDITQQQAKALDIQRQIMEKSTDAQTAFKEGGDSMARTQAEATAKIREVKDTLATALWPQLKEITAKISDVIIKFTENDKAMDATIATLWFVWDVVVETINFLWLMWEGIANIIERSKQFVSRITVNFWMVKTVVWEVVTQVGEWFTWLGESIKTALWGAVDRVIGVFWDLKSWVWSVIDWLTDKVSVVLNAVSRIKNAVSSIWFGGWDSSVDWARALGWPVKAWNSYLVWERWPEVFTPWSSWTISTNANTTNAPITLNLWGVTINNSQDEQRLVEIIEETLYKWQRNLSLWIA